MEIKNGKLIILVVIAVVILILNYHYHWSNYIKDPENLKELKFMVHNNFWHAVLIYMVITIIGCVALAIPGITFSIFAGVLFGPWIGAILCLIATTISACIAFIIGRFFMKDSIKPLIEKHEHLKKLLFENSSKNEILALLITRIVPIFPYNLQNFAYGVTDIGFWKYTICTFLFMAPGISLITIGTSTIINDPNKGLHFAIILLIVVFVCLIAFFIYRKVRASYNVKS